MINLNLNENGIKDEGIFTIAEMSRYNKMLKYIFIMDNNIIDK